MDRRTTLVLAPSALARLAADGVWLIAPRRTGLLLRFPRRRQQRGAQQRPDFAAQGLILRRQP